MSGEESARERLARASESNARPSQVGELDGAEFPKALRAIAASEGADSAARVAEALLLDELQNLELSPLIGARFVLTSLEVAVPTGVLVEAACAYLSLYFQELDEAVSGCRELAAQDAEDSMRLARTHLLEHVKHIEGIRATAGTQT